MFEKESGEKKRKICIMAEQHLLNPDVMHLNDVEELNYSVHGRGCGIVMF